MIHDTIQPLDKYNTDNIYQLPVEHAGTANNTAVTKELLLIQGAVAFLCTLPVDSFIQQNLIFIPLRKLSIKPRILPLVTCRINHARTPKK